MSAEPTVSVVIPSFERGEVLRQTVENVLALSPPPHEILIVDQTPLVKQQIREELEEWHRIGRISWLRLEGPSIPRAMNEGLQRATGDVVLFIDDDVLPARDLVGRHAIAHGRGDAELVVGQVLEPGQQAERLIGAQFAFRSSVAQPVDEVIGCNFSVRRLAALELGGFDENFVAVAYRFEADFCERARAAGLRIFFEPSAAVLHLRAESGGTRSFGEHLRTIRPSHSVGEYYFLLKSRQPGRWRGLLSRPVRAIRTRHHLRRPWWIPATLAAEVAGFCWAAWFRLRGERTLPRRVSRENAR